ncbi:class I SAM-dependent rRNA methyltransferase [Planctomicrobium sp. SH661]|uniref:class I SAM-dependent rRNA methyltransferase n=1 Tax=Planctomicrobium sp. SH661 TaxID=3448124 RepID=UPI003F5B2589
MNKPPVRHTRPANPHRRETRFPLDPSHLVQRSLDDGTGGTLPIVKLKSPTKNPTVFRKRIAEVDPKMKHGDLVQVKTTEQELVGYGLWNPRAEATVRILSWDNVPTSADWWGPRLDAAVSLRRDSLQLDEVTGAYRVINAEGDSLPGIVVDRYGDLLSLEVFSLGMYQRAEAIAQSLAKRMQIPHWVVRPGPATLEQEGFTAEGFSSPGARSKVQIREHGVAFEINPTEGHKTGFFCDQRDNRLRLREFCKGKTVLDLCSYTGGFAINAAFAGAKEVTAVDLDEEAIRQARRNAQLNKSSIKFVHADAFSYLRDMQRNGKTYDVIILDPPKLIHSREEAAEGQSKYFDLNKLAAPLVASGGLLLTCSCSGLFSMDELTRTVRAACGDRRPQLLMRSGAAPDHPVALSSLESEYLKCLWLRMD